jgi:glucose/mannose-6-phosphate isomerase
VFARELQGSVPVIYGGGPTVACARRWKNQLNENAKVPAFWGALPEIDHNEVCGWDRAGDFGRMHAVFLDDPAIDARTRRRIAPTARVARPSSQVEAVGESQVQRVLSLVLLGDLVSVYLAALDGVDPSDIAAIERLKAELGPAAKP